MKRVIIGGLTTALVLLGGLAFTGGTASATRTEKCYGTQVQEQINKETRTRIVGELWTPWTDWPDAGPVWDDGRDRSGHHGGAAHGYPGDRDYRYVVVGTRNIQVEVPCPPPTTSSTTTTTTTTTTVPETTVPAASNPTTTATVDDDQCPEVDGALQYRQSYADDAPCGPVDPCVGINPETGLGTTLWMIQPCGTPVTTIAECTTGVTNELGGCEPVGTPDENPTHTTVPPSLPSTGPDRASTAALIGGIFLLFGTGLTMASRRR